MSSQIKFRTKPIEEKTCTGVHVSWLSEDDRFKVTRVVNAYDRDAVPRYAALKKDANALAKDGFNVIGHDPILGATHPKYHKSIWDALAAIEQSGDVLIMNLEMFKEPELQESGKEDKMTTSAPVKGKKMRVSRETAIDLLKALGFKVDPATFDNKRLQGKLKALPGLSNLPELEDEDLEKVLDDITKAVEDGEGILVKGDDEMATDAPEKTKGKDKKPKEKGTKPKEKGTNGKSEKAKPKKRGPRGVGVIATIIECLSRATSKSPVTVNDVHKVLVKRFPDRDPKSMLSTVRSQIPSGLRVEKKVEVSKSDEGFWLPKSEQAKLPSK